MQYLNLAVIGAPERHTQAAEASMLIESIFLFLVSIQMAADLVPMLVKR